jgi:16S rRNA processing protein RimM
MSRSAPEPERASWRPERVVVGRIGRPHGLDGSVYLEGHGGLVPLEPGTPVEVDGRPARVAGRKGTDTRPIVRFDAASDRESAQALRGGEVTVAAELLPAPQEDEYLHVDLVGCRVVSGGRTLGTVRDVLSYPANDVLEIDGPGGGLLVPFVADVVEHVDVRGRAIAVRAGFLD